MNKILFYSSIPSQSRDQLMLMQDFKKKGHKVYFINRSISPFFKNSCEFFKIHYFEYKAGHLPSLFYLLWKCYSLKIDTLYSHLEPNNFLAVVAQYLTRTKVTICRHHSNEASLYGFDKSCSYRFTYKFACRVVVVSQCVKEYMVLHEKVNSNKIHHINLAYNFSLFPKADRKESLEIRETYGSPDILLVTIARLTKYKRVDKSIRVIDSLKEKGIFAKLLILGAGELEDELKTMVTQLKLEDQVYFTGYVTNVMSYLHACDYLLHPSVLEACCVVIKEAGLSKKPVIVCEGICGYHYIHDRANGFLTEKDTFEHDASNIIQQTYKNSELLSNVGINLEKDVKRLFDIKKLSQKHLDLILK